MTTGGATRCSGNRLRVPRDGHGGRCGGSLERSTIFWTQKFQSSRGEDPAGVWKSDAAGASKHSQIS